MSTTSFTTEESESATVVDAETHEAAPVAECSRFPIEPSTLLDEGPVLQIGEQFKNILLDKAKLSGFPNGEMTSFFPEVQWKSKTLRSPIVELKYDISKQQGEIWFKEAPPPETASSVTFTLEKHGRYWSSEELRKFVHDFTFGIFSDQNDVPLRNVFSLRHDDDDNLSPDMIVKDEDGIFIFEFATSASDVDNVLRDTHRTKMFKYLEPLKRRINELSPDDRDGKYFMFSSIVVSDSKVVCGLDLPDTVINELCARCCFARGVVSSMIKLGLPMDDDQKKSDKIGMLGILNSIKPEYDPNEKIRGMTEEVVNTEDIPPEMAAEYAMLAYRISLYNAVPLALDADRSFKKKDQEAINDYREKTNGSRLDLKSVIQLPGILPALRTNSIPSAELEEKHLMFDVWNDAFYSYTMGGCELELSLEEAKVIAELPEGHHMIEEMKASRASYKRVYLDNISETDRIDLAKMGVEGKRYKNNEEVNMHRFEKKESFSWCVDRSDIESFLTRSEHFEQVPIPASQEVTKNIIMSSFDNYENANTTGIQGLMPFTLSSFYQYCDMVTDIGIELSISLKQNCKRGQFILKRLRARDMWLLIKQTNSSSHIFVSFLWQNEGSVEVFPSPVFKKIIVGSNYSCTEFVSFNSSKLVNLVKCGPFSLSQFSQWARYLGILDKSWPNNKEFWFLMRMMVLIHLEDKSSTESVFSLFRYISMEKFVERNMDRTKCLEKFPKFYRSRFAMWAAEKLIHEMATDAYEFCGDPDEPGKGYWGNMINPYSGFQITEPNNLIELYYVGYAKNKEESSSANVDFQLVRKIVKCEQLLEDSNPLFFGKSSPILKINQEMAEGIKHLAEGEHYEIVDEPDGDLGTKNHEWAKLSNIAAADAYRYHLFKAYGNDWRDILDDKIRERLYAITWEQIATLKASSTYDPMTGKEWVNGKIKTKREKAIEAVLKLGSILGKRPYKGIAELLEWVQSHGGMRVDLFKKMQHVSLREIYVMHIRSRIIQLIQEEMARAMASFLDIELMMHPANKVKLPQDHARRSERVKMPYKRNVSSSNDAAVWNQMHHVVKFAQFLCRILPSYYKGFTVNCLKQWLSKKIALPDGVLNLLRARPGVLLSDPVDSMIADAFTGVKEYPWLDPGSHHLVIESGMMQGILHYTSSVYHGSVLLLRDDNFKTLMRLKKVKMLTTDMVSSDDSGRLTDVCAMDLRDLTEGVNWARTDHLAMANYCSHFGIKASKAKSTVCTQRIYEINSEFFDRESLCRPTEKWVLASMNMTEDESIYARQEGTSNNLTSVAEGGSGFQQASEIQYAQAVLHYKLMGSSVSILWTSYARALQEAQDPSLGYFLMDHPQAAGLYGLNFAFYCACMKNPRLASRLADQLNEEVMTTTKTGNLTRGVQVRFGNRKKAQALVDRVSENFEDWKEVIEENPEIMYRFPETQEELTCKILVKLTSPNVTTALSSSNCISKMISSAVYVIGMHATTIGSAWMDINEGLKKEKDKKKRLEKTTLWKLLKREPSNATMSKEQVDVLFPLNNYYEAAKQLLKEIGTLPYCKGASRRKLRSQISVFPEALELPHSLEQMVRWKWFGWKTIGSTRMLDEIWAQYRLRLKWLRDDISSTLEASPFDSHIELRNVIARDAPRHRTVHLTGSPVAESGSRDMIASALIRNQFPGYSLLLRDGVFRYKIHESTSQALHAAASICTFPLTNKETLKHLEEALCRIPQIWFGEHMGPSPRIKRLACIQMFFKLKRLKNLRNLPEEESIEKMKSVHEYKKRKEPQGSLNLANMNEITFDQMLRGSRMGIKGGFTKPQRLEGDKWVGEGEWLGSLGGVTVQLSIRDSILTKIYTKDINALKDELGLLSSLLFELRVTPTTISFSQTPYSYDGKGINFNGRGAAVILTSLGETRTVDLSEMRVSVNEFNIRLIESIHGFEERQWRKLPGTVKTVTIASFRVQQTDFDWNAHFYNPKEQRLLKKWSRNEPAKLKVIHKLIENATEENRWSKKRGICPRRFKEFCKLGTNARLVSQGWDPSRHMMLPEPTSGEEDAEDEDWNFNIVESSVNLRGLNILKEDLSPIIPPIRDEYAVSSDLGKFEFKMVENKNTIGDIRKSHLFFKKFTDTAEHVSKSDKRAILRKKRPKSESLIARTLVLYYQRIYEWEFGEHEEESCDEEEDESDDEEYDFYLGSEDDDDNSSD